MLLKNAVPSSIRSGVRFVNEGRYNYVRRQKLGEIFFRLKNATMVDKEAFIDNLELAQTLATQASTLNGCIVECGTWKGGMAAGLMSVLGPNRHYHFFDSFAGLPPAKDVDGADALLWQANVDSPLYFNNCTASRLDLEMSIALIGKQDTQYSIHEGLFEDTVPIAPVGDIALLRLDGDWYDSTFLCLNALLPKLLPGGIVIIDDYGTWDGCTRAVHDFLSLQKLPWPINRYGRSAVPFIRAPSR